MKLLRNPQRSSTITTPPLVTLIAGLVCAAVPVFDRITGWAIALFFVACVARLWMNRPGGRLPSLPLKVLLFGLSVGGIAITYGTALGVEPGLSILLLLISLKLLETNTVRDFQVMCLLGYFLALCDLFFAQTLTLWLYVSAVFVLITAALIRFHRGAGPASLRRSARTVVWLMIQALPLVLILFVFLPRSRQQFLMQFSQPLLGSSGMSDRLSPGSIASLALNQEVVFRADFPDGNVPSMSQMYWRAGILWHGDGLTWTRGPQMTPERRVGQLTGPLVRQRIILQPHGLRWLYALDRPAAVEARGAHFEAGGILQSNRPVLKRMQYDVFSRPENREVILPADQRVETLRLPAHTSPDVVALVRGWRTAHPADRALVEAALQYFRTERFVYTLEPGTYESADPLRDFLFERRAGFCEHYAAAYATLMRLAGIPSRVVIGYHGGEYNSLGKYVMVRQSDAHAWCEVWIKGEGWLRVDPTDVIAPDRLTSGLDTFLQTRAGANQPANQSSSAVTGWRDLQREARLAWDNLNHQWDLRVLGFDEENQRTFLASFGFGDFKWIDFLVWMVTPSALILGLVGLWLRRPGRSPSDPIVRTYARFCQRLASAGLPREPAEGPHHYGERAATHFPAAAAQIRAIIALYTALRYSPTPPAPALLRRALRALPRRLRTEPAS